LQCPGFVLFFFFFSPHMEKFKTNIIHTANIFCAKKQCLLCPPNPKSQFSSQVIVTTNYNSHFGLINNNNNNNNQYWFKRTPKQGKVNFLGYYPILQHRPCPCNFLGCNVKIIFFSITWGIRFFSVHFLWIKLMLILWALFNNKNSCLQTFSFFCKASLWFNYCIACLVLCSGLNRLYHGIAPPRKQNYAWTSGSFNFTRFDNLLCLFSGIMSIPSCTYSLPFVQAWPSHSLSLLCLNCNIGWRLAVDISSNKF